MIMMILRKKGAEGGGEGRGGEAKGRGWGDGTGHERLKHYGKLGG